MATVKGIQKDPLIPGSKANRALFPSKANKPLTPAKAKQLAATNTAYNKVTKSSKTPLLGVKPTSTSGFGLGTLKAIGHEAGILGKQVVALPKTTGEGFAAIGSGALHDIEHGPSLGTLISNPSKAYHESDLAHLAKSAVVSDPIVEAVKSHSLAPLAKNPLGTIMDATVVGAPVIKAADAAAAVGDVGEDATLGQKFAAGASAFRHGAPRETLDLPHASLSTERNLSQDPIVRAVQKKIDASPEGLTAKTSRLLSKPVATLKREGSDQLTRAIQQRADENYALGHANTNADLARALKAMHGTRAEETEMRDLAGHLRTGAPEDVTALRGHIQQRLNRINDAIHQATEHPDSVDNASLEQMRTNADHLRSALAHPDEDLQAAATHARARSDIQNAIDTERVERGLAAPSMRPLIPHAQEYMNATHTDALEHPIPTERALMAKAAKEDYVDAQKDLERVRARKNLPLEEKAAQMKAARDEVKVKRQAFLAAGNPNEKVTGWVRPVPGGHVRLTPEDIHADMAMRGIDPASASYSSMRPPNAETEAAVANPRGSSVASRGGSPGPHYGGSAFEHGSYQADEAADSQGIFKNIRALHRARTWDRGVQDVGIKKPDTGEAWDAGTIAGRNEMDAFAKKYKEQTGIQLEKAYMHPARTANEDADTIADRQSIARTEPIDKNADNRAVLMPKAYMDRMRQFDEAKQGGTLTSAVRGATNMFRAGVLPLSANYWMSVPQEGLFRGLVTGKLWNTTRTFNDVYTKAAAGAADATLPTATRLAYKDLHDQMSAMTHGLQFGQSEMDLMNQSITRDTDPHASVTAAKKLYQTMMKPGQFLLKGPRKVEALQSKVVVSATFKDMKRSMGSMDDVMKALTEGKDAHNLMAKAQHDINDTLGRYTVRSPTEQTFIRNYAPFWSWLSNATKFVYVTMPRDNPLTNAIMTKIGQANAQAWAQQHAAGNGLMVPFLGTNYGSTGETVGGMDVLRNTPYGVGEQTPLEDLSTIAPVEQSVLTGALGLNSFGDKLKAASGVYGQDMQAYSSGAMKNMLSQVGADVIPYYSFGRKVVQGATGNVSKTAQLSHNPYLRTLENAAGGSLIPHHYTSSTPAASSSSSLGSGLGSSTSSGLGTGLGGSSKTLGTGL